MDDIAISQEQSLPPPVQESREDDYLELSDNTKEKEKCPKKGKNWASFKEACM